MTQGLIKSLGLKEVIRQKHEEIQKLYLSDKRPWIIGYSGGKDSTTTLQLVYNALKELPIEKLLKPVYVVASDTLIENPLILNYLQHNIQMIQKFAVEDKLPISAHLVRPTDDNSFWTLLIGKGYPSPRQTFRWCTSRLKIAPIDNFIAEQTSKYDEVIVVLGVRRSESQSRQQSIESRTIAGKLLKNHASNPKAYVYAPIEDFHLDDVWSYLMLVDNPWKCNNKTLLGLYRDSSDESECPIQQDKDAPSCGKSRFGCWTCTVVAEDKSLTGFIQNGYDDLGPLLYFRNWLYGIREKEEYRQKWRMDGSIYFLSTQDNKKKQGFGPFNLKARKEILEHLLEAEIEYNNIFNYREKTEFDTSSPEYVHLIQLSELNLIREQWIKDGDWEDSLPKIYNKVTGKEFPSAKLESPLLRQDELELLEQVCIENELPSNVIKKLLLVEDKFLDIKIRKGLMREINSILRQDWIHENIIQVLLGEENQDET